ncbi:MAG: hypothetical protein KGI54_15760 [Pseudomonadota bacterium]|nr:hypothetical protein [Pseudomonadota bacterium]
MSEKITAIKGFDQNFQCRGFQYTAGESYTHKGNVKPCKSGFHAIEGYPLEVFRYYPPGKSRFAEVLQSGTIQRHDNDSKTASSKISVLKEISLEELIQRAVKWTFEHTKSENSKHSDASQGIAANSGDYGAAANSGDYGAATNSGFRGAAANSGSCGAAANSGSCGAAANSGSCGAAANSGSRGAAANSGACGAATNSGYCGAATNSGACGAATNSGYYGAAANSGYYGAAVNSGSRGVASSTGLHGAAMASGAEGKVMGEKGNLLVLTFRNPDGSIKHGWHGIVGKKGIKPNVWYTLNSEGEPEEVK